MIKQNESLLATLAESAAALVGTGHREDAVYDAMLTVSMDWAIKVEGPREVGRRLYLLALQAAALADEIDRDQASSTIN